MPPLLTVIICTCNRAFILGDCLDSLCAQTISTANFQVLVVDNNSTDNTRDVVTQYMGRLPGLQYIFESRQGLSHARNLGLQKAQTNWLAFLDDDAKAHPNWVETILAVIAQGDFDAFGGPYLPWHKYGPPPAWFDPQWESSLTIQNHYGLLPPNLYPIGCNCAVKKECALAAGAFPVNMGMAGNTIAYAEETILFETMRQAQYRLGFVPGMLIDHCVLPHKYTLRWRLLSAYANGRDNFFVRPCSPARAFLRLGKALLWRLPQKILWCHQQKSPWQRALLECLCPVLTAMGGIRSAILQNFCQSPIFMVNNK